MNLLTALSLLFDVIGAVLLFIGADKLNNVLTELMETTAKTIGFWQDDPIEKKYFENLMGAKKISNNLNKWGLLLLVLGFLGQLIAALYT